jgi:hypothetical protein
MCDAATFNGVALHGEGLLGLFFGHEQAVYAQAQQSTACMASHDVQARLFRRLLRARFVGKRLPSTMNPGRAPCRSPQRNSRATWAENVFRAAFDGVEADDADRLVVLPVKNVRDRGLKAASRSVFLSSASGQIRPIGLESSNTMKTLVPSSRGTIIGVHEDPCIRKLHGTERSFKHTTGNWFRKKKSPESRGLSLAVG